VWDRESSPVKDRRSTIVQRRQPEWELTKLRVGDWEICPSPQKAKEKTLPVPCPARFEAIDTSLK